MPIQISDYTWHQTNEKVLLSLDLHHTSPKKVDIMTTSSYLKVSFLPYIFEAFLCNLINTSKSSAKILQGRVELDLQKENSTHWIQFCRDLTKDEKQKERLQAIIDFEEQEKKKEKQRREDHTQRERFVVSQQISEDDKIREERARMIEQEKSNFMKMATDEQSEDLRRRLSSTCSEEGTVDVHEMDYDGDGEDSHYYSSTENLNLRNNKMKVEKAEISNRKQRKSNSNRKALLKMKEEDMKSCSDEEGKEEEEGDKKKRGSVIPVRPSGNIRIKHTPRVFPTPSRESCQAEEQEWLSSQSSTTKSTNKDSAQGHTEQYYKEKAISLFGNGDYVGCVNACTEGLKLNPKAAALYSNRAVANLALCNAHHVISDCSKALELLIPPTQENRKSRLLCHVRRGTAFVLLSLHSEGLQDYQAALQLDPENESLKKDVNNIESLCQNTDEWESYDEQDDDDDDAKKTSDT